MRFYWRCPLAVEYSRKFLDQKAESWIGDLEQRCKSPIELRFGFSLLAHLDCIQDELEAVLEPSLYMESIHDYFRIEGDYEYHAMRIGQIHVFSQVSVGRYRADFAVSGSFVETYFKKPDGRDRSEAHQAVRCAPIIIIECDGHDFHERTQDQALHDRRRDREMTSAGYRVVRFTGREIHRDPDACAEEVGNLLDKLKVESLSPINKRQKRVCKDLKI